MGLLDVLMPYKPGTTGLGPNRPAVNSFTDWYNQNRNKVVGGFAGMVGAGNDPRAALQGLSRGVLAGIPADSAYGQVLQKKAEEDKAAQQAQAQQTATVKWLMDSGQAELASAVQQGLVSGADAFKTSWDMKHPKPTGPTVVGKDSTLVGSDGKVLYQNTQPEAPYKPNFDDISGIRKEVFNLQSYKKYATAAPIYEAMKDAAGRDSRASDLNLVYGLASIMDPTSVVREGEQIMVQNTASLPSWLQGQINALNGGASLDPQTRERIMQEAYGRTSEYEKAFAAEAQFYENIGNRYGINNADIIPPYSAPQVWKAPVAPVQSTGDPELDSILQQYGG